MEFKYLARMGWSPTSPSYFLRDAEKLFNLKHQKQNAMSLIQLIDEGWLMEINPLSSLVRGASSSPIVVFGGSL